MQPQNSVPDVIIWMLSDKKRVAVKRIPSHELMYSSTTQSGKNCGKLMTIYLTVSAIQYNIVYFLLKIISTPLATSSRERERINGSKGQNTTEAAPLAGVEGGQL